MPAGQRAGPWGEGSAPIRASLGLPLARVNGAAGRAVLMLPVDAPKRNRKQWFAPVRRTPEREAEAGLPLLSRAHRATIPRPALVRYHWMCPDREGAGSRSDRRRIGLISPPTISRPTS